MALGGSFSTLVAMTLLLPFLPLYIEELGIRDPAMVPAWSGAAYAASFLSAGLVAPLWGRLADRYGRKLMLIRASLGMSVAMSLIGLARTPVELVGLRLLAGLLGGYSSGSMILVATETPKARSAWALGMLSSGVMAGNLVGPLIGGVLPPLIGIRATFLASGGVIFVAFLATLFLIREQKRPAPPPAAAGRQAGAPAGAGAVILARPLVAVMLATLSLLMVATMSIEPIITVYVETLVPDPAQVTFVSGCAMSATALGSILAAPRLGRMADRLGHGRVIIASLSLAALLLIPQAMVTTGWQLVGLRFLMGLALGGLVPCITAIIRHAVPETVTGAVLGYSISAQYAGQVTGPLLGGYLGGHYGMRAVFLGTAVLLAAAAIGLVALFRWQRRQAARTI